jgi:hypothetical protein
MLHNGIYYYKCSTCFRQLLCPSSGAQDYTQHRVFVEVSVLLTAIVIELELQQRLQLTHDSSKKQKNSTNTQCCVNRFGLLMMGGGTA